MQPLDPQGVYTDDDVRDVLTGRYGPRTLGFRYDRLNSLNKYIEPIELVRSCNITNNALADIKRTARFNVVDRTAVDFLKDRIRPWVRLPMPDGGVVEWPQGVFLLATPDRQLDGVGLVSRDIEGYDQLLVLQDDKVLDRYSVAAGVAYTTAISTLIATVTGMVVAIVPSALTLPAAVEWEPGTTKLRILNDLLGAINYESAYFDEAGTLVCRPYLSPQSRAPEYTYDDGSATVRSGNASQTLDLYDIPNRWRLVKSEADQAALTSTYTNTSPTSPTSTVSRGRTIVKLVTEQDAADQATLDAKAARLGFEASQVFEVVKFDTAIMPFHSNADVLTLDIPALGVAAKYSEHTWSFKLDLGERMSHTVRRVVTVS